MILNICITAGAFLVFFILYKMYTKDKKENNVTEGEPTVQPDIEEPTGAPEKPKK